MVDRSNILDLLYTIKYLSTNYTQQQVLGVSILLSLDITDLLDLLFDKIYFSN